MKAGKHPAKAVDKEYRRLDATRQAVHGGVQYTFPDGARLLVPSNISWASAHSMIAEVHRRYDAEPERDCLTGDRVSPGSVPAFDKGMIHVTEHARQRHVEMAAQDGMTADEIMNALTLPMRVLFVHQTESYVWVGERISVVGYVRGGRLTIRTFLWSTNELWARHPRPEKEASIR